MATIRQITPSPPRTPLQDTTNSMSPEPSSPFHTAKTSQSNKTRRKLSLSFFRRQGLDSSECLPSPHSSLWDASLADQSQEVTTPIGNWDSSCADITPPSDEPGKKKKSKRRGKDKPPSPPAAIKSSPSLAIDTNVHHPHLLDTITERSSLHTLRSHHPSIKSLQRGSPSVSTLRARTLALRKESFSLADLPIVPPSPLKSSRSSESLILNGTIRPNPNTPTHDPPERMPTPPGLPKFNTPEAINYRLPSPQTSFRQKFRRHPTPEQIVYRRQTSHLPPGVVMRGERGELIRGRFKQGGLSGHTGYGTQGALEKHPFNRAPVAQVVPNVDTAAEASENDPGTRGASAPTTAEKKRNGTRWQRFVELTCFVCCGVEATMDGQVVRAIPSRTADGVAPRSGADEAGSSQMAMMTGAVPVGEAGKKRKRGFRRFGNDGWVAR
ncbi:MAG: hypothetical protein LQ350_000721 [Teloschistes chrysophthalmus]|nr:MAG: hypothetical protein LQ350_000721 [Niorma chrysophthalma]